MYSRLSSVVSFYELLHNFFLYLVYCIIYLLTVSFAHCVIYLCQLS